MPLSAIDDNGKPVDWWFMYKVARKSKTGDGRKMLGTEYVYFDANTPAKGKLTLSPHTVDQAGALPNTLNQVYGAAATANTHLGWFFYNDENPITGKTNGSRGHTKGVLAFDLESNSAFWLVHSVPKFALKDAYGYPPTGLDNAQTLLCITLANADVAQAIAKQMFVAQQPNVYLASAIPADLSKEPNDARVKLIQDQVASGSTPVAVVIPFNSKGGLKFMAIAKNKTWGLDFYNDLVGPTLHENLEVETWEHDPTPPPEDSDKVHTVVAMTEVDLNPLGIDITWSEEADHAKLAISAPTEAIHYVCVGDINFTIAQEKRGGGTVAFQSEALWQSLSEILKSTTPAPQTSSPSKTKAARPASKTSSRSKTARPKAKKSKTTRKAKRTTKTKKTRR